MTIGRSYGAIPSGRPYRKQRDRRVGRAKKAVQHRRTRHTTANRLSPGSIDRLSCLGLRHETVRFAGLSGNGIASAAASAMRDALFAAPCSLGRAPELRSQLIQSLHGA